MAYDKTNRGTLGRNQNKKEDNHPDHKGSLNVAGIDYWISAWVKTNAETGEKFFSLAVKPKDSQDVREEKAHGKDLGGRPGKHAGFVPANQRKSDDDREPPF